MENSVISRGWGAPDPQLTNDKKLFFFYKFFKKSKINAVSLSLMITNMPLTKHIETFFYEQSQLLLKGV